MRGSWVTTFAVGGVVVLLTLFLGLQYNWLRQAGDAERERMQRRVQTDTKNFADDLNREINAAYFNFQLGADAWRKKDFADFDQRLNFWKDKTRYPELIREFVFIPKDDGRPERYDPTARTFAPFDLPPELEPFRSSGLDRSRFVEEASLLVMPIYEEPEHIERIVLRRSPAAGSEQLRVEEKTPSIEVPERLGTLLIILDRGVITDKMLPELTARHFPEGNFNVAVTNKNADLVYGPAKDAGEPDATARLMSLSADNVMFFTNAGTGTGFSGEKREGVVVNQRVETSTFSRTQTEPDGSTKGQFTVRVKPGPDPANDGSRKTRTSVFAATEDFNGPWELSVRHKAGSIGAFIDGEFIRNLLIGVGLYVLLVGAIVAIVISAMRSKRFAQRQIDFVSSVSHEFRTPLAVIYSAGENLADGVAHDTVQVSRYGSLIKGEGRKLSAMVEQILQFAGARSGNRTYNFAPASPAELIGSALKECNPLLSEKGFEVETAVDNDIPVIDADADAISIALRNLIGNAVKYSNGSRWLKLSATNGGGVVKFEVEDRGIGIPGGELKQVFEPFYRAKEVVDAQIHGNGLGLALVKEIVRAHGGSVHASSEVGKGSRFTIELPQTRRKGR